MSKDHALYALEDILGGHTAVMSIAVRNLVDLAENRKQSEVEDLQSAIQSRLDQILEENEKDSELITLSNKSDLPIMNAAMFETIRLTCSPIVPHQASKDSTVGGKNTLGHVLPPFKKIGTLYHKLR